MIKDFPHKRIKKFSYKRTLSALFFGILIFAAGLLPAFAGDVFYGTASEVRNAEVMVVDLEDSQEKYIVRIVGIDTPKDGPLADKAKEFVSTLLLGKSVRARFEGRNTNGEMVSRLFYGHSGHRCRA